MLKKIVDLQINFALIAFCTFTLKMLIVSPSIADGIITAVLGGSYMYTQYLKRFQPYKLDDAVAKDLIEMRNTLSRLNMINASQKMAEKKYF